MLCNQKKVNKGIDNKHVYANSCFWCIIIKLLCHGFPMCIYRYTSWLVGPMTIGYTGFSVRNNVRQRRRLPCIVASTGLGAVFCLFLVTVGCSYRHIADMVCVVTFFSFCFTCTSARTTTAIACRLLQLFVCEFCLKYMRKESTLDRHRQKCPKRYVRTYVVCYLKQITYGRQTFGDQPSFAVAMRGSCMIYLYDTYQEVSCGNQSTNRHRVHA